MLERLDPTFRIVCLGLAALVFYQVARIAARRDPLARLNIPALASQAASPDPQSGQPGTNFASRPEPATTRTNLPPDPEGIGDKLLVSGTRCLEPPPDTETKKQNQVNRNRHHGDADGSFFAVV